MRFRSARRCASASGSCTISSAPGSRSPRTAATSIPTTAGSRTRACCWACAPLAGLPAVALDPNVLPADGNPVVVGYVASRDAQRVAYGVSLSGSDWTDWHIRDLRTGADTSDVLRFTKYYRAGVHPRRRRASTTALFPRQGRAQELSAPDLGNAIYYHALGTPAAADRRMLSDRAHPGLAVRAAPDPGRPLAGGARRGGGSRGQGPEDVYLIDLQAPTRAAVPRSRGFGAAFIYVGAGRRAALLPYLAACAANGRVVAVDPLQPQRRTGGGDPRGPRCDRARCGRRQRHAGGRRADRATLHEAHHRVLTYGLDGTLRGEVALPGAGTGPALRGSRRIRETFYSFSDLVPPRRSTATTLPSGSSSAFRHRAWPSTRRRSSSTRCSIARADGTRIPMWLAWRRVQAGRQQSAAAVGLWRLRRARAAGVPGRAHRLARDGRRHRHRKHPRRRGVRRVLARAGTRTHKQVVFDDFIAAARVADRAALHVRAAAGDLRPLERRAPGGCVPHAAPAAVRGGGDRGGRACSTCCASTASARARAGRGLRLARGPAAVRARCTPTRRCTTCAPGTRYPATLVITGDHDTRVMPMHSFKFAAALQAAQAGRRPDAARGGRRLRPRRRRDRHAGDRAEGGHVCIPREESRHAGDGALEHRAPPSCTPGAHSRGPLRSPAC